MTVVGDEELSEQPEPVQVSGRNVDGGPQMIQVSITHYPTC